MQVVSEGDGRSGEEVSGPSQASLDRANKVLRCMLRRVKVKTLGTRGPNRHSKRKRSNKSERVTHNLKYCVNGVKGVRRAEEALRRIGVDVFRGWGGL